jgi:hypothetical protein
MSKLFALGAASVAVLAGSAFGQIVVPGAGPGVTETTLASGLNTVIRSVPRAYQAYYSAANFASLSAPTSVNGLQFRLALGENWRPAGYTGQTWPPSDLNLGSYEITLAEPSAGLVADGEYLSTTPTFASYMVNPVVVRSGALTIPANSFVANTDGTPNAWGPTIGFSVPYTIDPSKGLIVQIRLTGYAPSTVPNAFFASTSFSNGFYDAVSSTASNTAAAPNGFSSPMFINFVPTPGAAGVLALAGLVAARRRRA